MKLCFRCGVPLIFLLSIIAFSHTSARFLYTKPADEKTMKLVESINTIEVPLADLETSNSFNEVMGMEDCESGDEECMKRRVLAAVADADAHLDYIYTQHHKP